MNYTNESIVAALRRQMDDDIIAANRGTRRNVEAGPSQPIKQEHTQDMTRQINDLVRESNAKMMVLDDKIATLEAKTMRGLDDVSNAIFSTASDKTELTKVLARIQTIVSQYETQDALLSRLDAAILVIQSNMQQLAQMIQEKASLVSIVDQKAQLALDKVNQLNEVALSNVDKKAQLALDKVNQLNEVALSNVDKKAQLALDKFDQLNSEARFASLRNDFRTLTESNERRDEMDRRRIKSDEQRLEMVLQRFESKLANDMDSIKLSIASLKNEGADLSSSVNQLKIGGGILRPEIEDMIKKEMDRNQQSVVGVGPAREDIEKVTKEVLQPVLDKLDATINTFLGQNADKFN